MNIIQKHEKALSKPNVAYHNFLKRYKKGETAVYIFCEGEEDIGYYAHAIQQCFPDLPIIKAFVGGKDNVIALSRCFDWARFSKNQVLFFVDRDMSYWLNSYRDLPDNIYVTDEYSFENDFVKEKHFIAFLEELCGFVNATEEELEGIRAFYLEKWKIFVSNSKYVMAALTISLKYTNEHLAKNFEHKKVIKIIREKVWVEEYDGRPLNDYVDEIFRIDSAYKGEIHSLIERFEEEPEKYFVRGKWALSFLVKMLNHVVQEGKHYAPSLYLGGMPRPKCLWSMEEVHATALLCTRITVVESLHNFCDTHILQYYEEINRER